MHVAAWPAAGLVAGTACGVFLPAVARAPAFLLLIIGVGVAAWAYRAMRTRWLALAVMAAFFAGGALLAADAWQRAWRPPLRVAFEALARDERAAAEREGRRLPEDDEAFAVVTGTLRADAAPSDAGGASLSIDVSGLEGRERSAASAERSGGILVTVGGALAADRMHEWRAGRRVRLPVQLHRPARYLDPGVPDYERALARRGTTLVGTV